MVLPEVLTAYGPSVYTPLAALARQIGHGEAGESDEVLAKSLIDSIASLRSQLELPLKPGELDSAEIPAIIKAAAAEAGDLYPVPRYFSGSELGGIVNGLT